MCICNFLTNTLYGYTVYTVYIGLSRTKYYLRKKIGKGNYFIRRVPETTSPAIGGLQNNVVSWSGRAVA